MDALDELRDHVAADLRLAMKARASTEVNALRALLGALDNATSVAVEPQKWGGGHAEVPRRLVEASEIAAIIASEIGRRSTSALEYDRLGMAENAAELRSEAAVLERYREFAAPSPPFARETLE
jgi:uncharacterized protein YqeY